jgi:hypothetical protein
MKTTEKHFKTSGLQKISWGQKLGISPTGWLNTHIVLFYKQSVGIKNTNLALFLKGILELSRYPQH